MKKRLTTSAAATVGKIKEHPGRRLLEAVSGWIAAFDPAALAEGGGGAANIVGAPL